MDINITEVERGLRFFGGPVCVTVVGLAGMAFVDQVTDIQGRLQGLSATRLLN